MSANTLADYFAGKPESRKIFEAIAARIEEHGPSDVSVGSQISFGVNRKFAWFWLYNVTKKNPSGVPHLMLAMDRKIEDPNVRDISQIGKSRWNHQIVIRSVAHAQSEWLGDLIEGAYAYGSA